MLSITERSNRNTTKIDLADGAEIARLINAEDRKVALVIKKILPQIGQAVEEITARLRKGGRMAYFGSGTSGRIGVLDASEIPPTFGAPAEMVQGYIAGGEKAIRNAVENAEDNEAFARRDYKRFNPQENDIVVGISAGGSPRYVLKVMELAREQGILTIAVTSNPRAKIKQYADIFLCTPIGPEAITGSSRMKSGTAQKMVLNMLSTGAMILLGKTYHNYMIDLEMTNIKLRKRAVRFVREITGATEEQAETVLTECQNVKTACVMILRRCSQSKAEELLRQNNGVLRRIID